MQPLQAEFKGSGTLCSGGGLSLDRRGRTRHHTPLKAVKWPLTGTQNSRHICQTSRPKRAQDISSEWSHHKHSFWHDLRKNISEEKILNRPHSFSPHKSTRFYVQVKTYKIQYECIVMKLCKCGHIWSDTAWYCTNHANVTIKTQI